LAINACSDTGLTGSAGAELDGESDGEADAVAVGDADALEVVGSGDADPPASSPLEVQPPTATRLATASQAASRLLRVLRGGRPGGATAR